MDIKDTREETTREVDGNGNSNDQKLEREHGFHK
jgi:hypothetical protein